MDRIEFLREWFYKEEERKNCLNDSLNIPIGILTALIALISYFFNEFNPTKESIYIKYPFYLFIIISLFFWVLSVFKLLQSYNDLYKGYSYLGFPKPSFLKDENEILKDYLKKHKKLLDKNTTLEELEKNSLEKLLIECLETNVYNNDRKSAYLHSSKIHIINSLILILILSTFFTANYIRNKEEKIQKIEVTNYNSSKMAQDDKRPMAPPPPQQPPRVIKESEQPRQSPPPQRPQPGERKHP
ncbi:hypothetical protein [uncultured Flavobacterium sp.]|uniref:hypothetical protein n=1 Tax=uncultured Flavobacterium sp. TaxID=165435 RepID=UPI00292DEFCD|nr:hypothetical protein [uncultured Flavobacterium sp.]